MYSESPTHNERVEISVKWAPIADIKVQTYLHEYSNLPEEIHPVSAHHASFSRVALTLPAM